MVWFIFAILSGFFTATYYMLVKKNLQNINQYVLSTIIFLTSSFILFIISFFKGIPEINPHFYSAVLIASALHIIAVTISYKAFKITDLSLAIPMTSFTPIFLILTSFLLLKELPKMFGTIGIILIVIGSYILNSSKNNKNLLEPIKSIVNNRGTKYMLIVAFLYSLLANYDKITVQNSDPIFSPAVKNLLIGTSFLIISFIKREKELIEIKKKLSKSVLVGIVFSLVSISTNIALSMQIVPYVISLKRLSILFSVIYGFIFFKEKNIFRRSISAVIMLSGVILIILFE